MAHLETEYDWEESNRQYWAEHGSPEALHRKLIDEVKRADRLAMGFWARMLDRLIDFLCPRYYERMWGRHVQRPLMRVIRRSSQPSENGS